MLPMYDKKRNLRTDSGFEIPFPFFITLILILHDFYFILKPS